MSLRSRVAAALDDALPAGWYPTWRRAVGLGAPVTARNGVGQLMRTTDVVISAALSPAAVVGLGIADLFASLPFRASGGVVGASATLTSQDTGAGADANRDEAFTQAALLAALVTLPFALVGIGLGTEVLRLVGADAESAREGARYLALVSVPMPLGALAAVSSATLEATGDTRTPTYVSVPASVFNAGASLVFGLGLLGAPRLGIVGIGAASLVAMTARSLVLVGYTHLRGPVGFVRPRDPTIARQIVRIGVPQSAAGVVTAVAVFPFNTLVLQFGTAANAGYQLAWRVYTQVLAPVGSGVGRGASIVVGQRLGERAAAAGDDTDGAGGTSEAGSTDGTSEGPAGSRDDPATLPVARMATALVVLGGGVALALGGGVALAAGSIARLLAEDPAVAAAATPFVTVLGLSGVLGITNVVASASLDAAGETRVPLASRVIGMFGGYVGVSWGLYELLGWGIEAAYAGQFACYVLMLAVTAWGLVRTDWVGRATAMLDERGSVGSDG
ncbi:MATE family efflux transporter [Halobaculum magnesiiphilum]|uniref:MATE family efflux transporter n=1 Tax=Halobaculum magnesiiphilum TaxID=1017351 RepID=A0A8T8WB38_9EURY|nr:MATE family efflux transporter [Halobaculum magnesiiphilum]QZP36974.1 MATE family efflux transporter [Halobaculum magnesiiphilum]